MQTCDLFSLHAGDCHLTEWSEWSSCELTCIDGRSFETTGRQARSRALIGQPAENTDSCSGQVVETRPCSGSLARVCPAQELTQVLLESEGRLVLMLQEGGVTNTCGKPAFGETVCAQCGVSAQME